MNEEAARLAAGTAFLCGVLLRLVSPEQLSVALVMAESTLRSSELVAAEAAAELLREEIGRRG